MSLSSYTLTGSKRLSQLLKYEAFSDFTRAAFTLLAGDGGTRKAAIGTVLAMTFGVSAVDVSQAADAGNTGDGTLALADPAFTSSVKAGVYTVVCTTGGADGVSKFRVEDPQGNQVGTATGGAAFAKQIKFTISGGAADFVEGDKFTVNVAIDLGDATNKVVAWDPAASDGTERIWGICLADIEADDGVDNQNGLALRRGPSIVDGGEIEWPDGITAAQKEAAILDLEAMNIIVR